MIGYMRLGDQVDADFSRARRRAFFRRATARLRNGSASDRLLCFEEFKKKLGAVGGIRLGPTEVRSTDIVGSVARCSDFDRDFLPVTASLGARWKRIDRAFHRSEELPPVSLYKVGGSYFVADGNHRVSVARYHGVEMIDAVVTEFRVPSPVEPTGAKPNDIRVSNGLEGNRGPSPEELELLAGIRLASR